MGYGFEGPPEPRLAPWASGLDLGLTPEALSGFVGTPGEGLLGADGLGSLRGLRGPGGGVFSASDIARREEGDAGVRGLGEVLEAAPGTPVIFYVPELRREPGVPRGAFGITNDAEELVHLVFDGLERGRMCAHAASE